MAWIQSHQSLERHPKVLLLKARMRWSKNETIGFLHRFWWTVLEYAPTGVIRALPPTLMAEILDMDEQTISQVVSVMVEVGLLDEGSGGLEVHDWHDFAGKMVERRIADTRRKRVHRTSFGHPPDGAKCPADGARRVEKSREEKKTTPPLPPSGPQMATNGTVGVCVCAEETPQKAQERLDVAGIPNGTGTAKECRHGKPEAKPAGSDAEPLAPPRPGTSACADFEATMGKPYREAYERAVVAWQDACRACKRPAVIDANARQGLDQVARMVISGDLDNAAVERAMRKFARSGMEDTKLARWGLRGFAANISQFVSAEPQVISQQEDHSLADDEDLVDPAEIAAAIKRSGIGAAIGGEV